MAEKFVSAFSTFGGFSYLVTFEMKTGPFLMEVRSRDKALKLCADLKKFNTECHLIDCVTGEKIKKIA